jgi:cell fate regulator YaaT (PSP1 superfamily)
MPFAARKKGEIARAGALSSNFVLPSFAFVRFKHETVLYASAGLRVSVGEYVVVEGDRGENVGMVEQLLFDQPSFPVPCSILRVASADEALGVTALRLQERELTQFVQTRADSLSIPMRIVDVECQFDRQKITIYFEADGVVDFRALQRTLYRHFGCRIWLVNWNEIRQSRV